MKAIGFLMVGAVALLASLAVACSDDDDTPVSGETASGSVSGGMIRPNTFMTYDGQRYELVNMLFESMVSASEFQEAGELSEADIDTKGDMRVFTRTGDEGAVYTYSAPSADDGGLWLAWRLLG